MKQLNTMIITITEIKCTNFISYYNNNYYNVILFCEKFNKLSKWF